MSFSSFHHTECQVEAMQMAPDTSADIVTTLAGEAGKGLLANFSATYNPSTNTYDTTYRYRTESTDKTLTIGNYLVKLNSGEYQVMTAEEFLAEYKAV